MRREEGPAPADSDAPAALRHCGEDQPGAEDGYPGAARDEARAETRDVARAETRTWPGVWRGLPRARRHRLRRRRLGRGFTGLACSLCLRRLLGLDTNQLLFGHDVAGGLDSLSQGHARTYHRGHVLEARSTASWSGRPAERRTGRLAAGRAGNRRYRLVLSGNGYFPGSGF